MTLGSWMTEKQRQNKAFLTHLAMIWSLKPVRLFSDGTEKLFYDDMDELIDLLTRSS